MRDKTKISIILTLAFLFILYSIYIYGHSWDSKAREGTMADKGKILWQKKNCNACHQVYGLGGYLGPDLTNIYSRRSEAQIRAFLNHGTDIMPDYSLTEQEKKEILAFLKSMDSTGVAAPGKFKINYDGTIER